MISIQNGVLLTPAFSQAFVGLMKIKGLTPKTKLELIKLKSKLEQTQTNLINLKRDAELDEQSMRDVLTTYEDYQFKAIPVKLVIEELSAMEISLLSPIIDMED